MPRSTATHARGRVRRLLVPLVVAATCGAAGVASAESGVVRAWRHDNEAARPTSSLLAVLRGSSGDQAQAADKTVVTPVADTTIKAPAMKTRALAKADAAVVVDPLGASDYDPLEPVNRVLFGINEAIDMVVLRPVSFVYRTVVPRPLRLGIANMVANAYAPVTFANDLLQGDTKAAKTTLVRFMVNSTAGFAGLVDAAAAAGLQPRYEDFGQTLAVWGAGPGPYLVVPALGPTTVRDGAGRIVDIVFNPLTWILWEYPIIERATPTMAVVVTTHESIMDELQAMRKTSPDFYASIRDIYLRKREADIANGTTPDAILEPINPSN